MLLLLILADDFTGALDTGVQFAARGMPLAGDRKYGTAEESAVPLALWACHLAFTHPESGERMDFVRLPPPQEPWTQFDRAAMERNVKNG